MAGAIKYAALARGPTKILVFLCDGGNKYVSKIYNDDWMRENGFLEQDAGLGTVRDILSGEGRKKVATASPSARVREVIFTLKDLGISQLPVVDKGKLNAAVLKVAAKSRDAAEAILAKFGAKNTVTLPPEQWQAVYDAFEEEIAKIDAAAVQVAQASLV